MMVIIIIINNTIIIMQFSFAKLQFAGYGRFTRKGAIIYSTIQFQFLGSNEILVNNIKYFPPSNCLFPKLKLIRL